MKFLSTRDLRSKSAETWKGLSAERERAFAAISAIQRQSIERGTDALTLAEIDAEISAVRQARRK